MDYQVNFIIFILLLIIVSCLMLLCVLSTIYFTEKGDKKLAQAIILITTIVITVISYLYPEITQVIQTFVQTYFLLQALFLILGVKYERR